ncbi:MAG: AI-2E family transporter, partial [Bacteroidota bacterium]
MVLQRTTYWLLSIALVIVLLIVAKDLLIPLVVAICIWYIINTIAQWLGKLEVGRIALPHRVNVVLAMVIVTLVIGGAIEIVVQSVESMVASAPQYDMRVKELLEGLRETLDLDEFPSFAQILHEIDVNSIVGSAAEGFSSAAGSLFLVIIYTIFLLLEQHTFRKKWNAIFHTQSDIQHAGHT